MTTTTKTIQNQLGEVFTITKEGPKSWYNLHAYGLTNRIVWRDQNDDMWVRANGEWIRVRYYTYGWLNASTNYNAVTPDCGEFSAVEITVEDVETEEIAESTTESIEAVETEASEQADTFETTLTQEQANELYHLRKDMLWSWWELANRYGIDEREVRRVYNAIHSGKIVASPTENAETVTDEQKPSIKEVKRLWNAFKESCLLVDSFNFCEGRKSATIRICNVDRDAVLESHALKSFVAASNCNAEVYPHPRLEKYYTMVRFRF